MVKKTNRRVSEKKVTATPVGTTVKVQCNHKLKTNLVAVNDTIIKATRRTKDSMYSLTDLCNSFNELNGADKYVKDYLMLKSTKELISELENEFKKENSPIKNVVSVYGGRYGGTWGHPLLWLDFAMWLSPKFKLACLKLISDKVIPIRIDTISNHKSLQFLLNEKLNIGVGQWICMQTDINMCAFGCSRNEVKNIRDNMANEEELKRLDLIQNTIEQMVECGIATDFCDIQKYLKAFHRQQWGRELYKKDNKKEIVVSEC